MHRTTDKLDTDGVRGERGVGGGRGERNAPTLAKAVVVFCCVAWIFIRPVYLWTADLRTARFAQIRGAIYVRFSITPPLPWIYIFIYIYM